jgi:hypothetical protein
VRRIKKKNKRFGRGIPEWFPREYLTYVSLKVRCDCYYNFYKCYGREEENEQKENEEKLIYQTDYGIK